ncbi:beta-N-acetylhexosaminidase [Cerasicoccus fimbriatus]|uniref:beta-N-acetylhexosaminidase n=1 Tax=Cerasicoccus fimbriatus TaxID=3014554 RepID=UPI0022B5D6F2|nr:family 20 glycosylhydrolase [Cerasicoccus sp. TK19100]
MLLIPEPRKIKINEGSCPGDVASSLSIGARSIPPQGYRLTIEPGKISIEAADAAGAFYAEQTLQQITEQSPEAGLPCLKISDWPDFTNRGYMLDISRDRVPTMPQLYRLIDTLATLRYNQLQLYTEHTFAYAGHETVWGMASPITAEEIEALDAYCADRHIELVPNQNSFGHFERWLKHEEYQELAECPDGFTHPITGPRSHGTTLRPNEESLSFLNELYDELLPHFTSTKFNVGGDEPWELGQGWSAPQTEVEGKHAIYARFLKRVCELAENHNAAPMCWADILLEDPAFIDELPAGVLPIIWGYEADHPFDTQCETVASTDRPYYVAPGDSSWNSFTGRVRNMLENVRSAARHGLTHEASGLLMTHWGDNGHPQTWPIAFPGLVAGGVFSWYGDAESNLDLTVQINRLFFKGEDRTAATVLLELGDVDRLLPVKMRNQSFLCTSLRLPVEELIVKLADCPESVLEAVVSQTWEWEASLNSTNLHAEDADWLRDELDLAIDMTRFAAQRCLAVKSHTDSPRQFSLSSGLRSELALIIGQYEKLWIRRSRVGGLYESSNILRRLM